jgi:formylglycine-generating enzyme required for sulfatase activity
MGTAAAAIEALMAQSPPDWVSEAFASEQPAHQVTLTSGYWIDACEVTNRSFQAFVDAGGYEDQAYWSEDGWAWLGRQDVGKLPTFCAENSPDKPRVCVTWYEAQAYATWRGGRLPTEAEWEFAARGPDSLVYPWGDEWDSALANVEESDGLVKGGSYPEAVSWVGAYDMAGNAMEWVSDWLSSTYYGKSPLENPTGPEDGRIKVEKGGWWGSNPFVARSAYRHYEDPPTYQDHHIGFRIVTP